MYGLPWQLINAVEDLALIKKTRTPCTICKEKNVRSAWDMLITSCRIVLLLLCRCPLNGEVIGRSLLEKPRYMCKRTSG